MKTEPSQCDRREERGRRESEGRKWKGKKKKGDRRRGRWREKKGRSIAKRIVHLELTQRERETD